RTGTATTPVAEFSALCRLRDRSYVVGSVQHAPVTAVINGFAGTSSRGSCLRTRSGKFGEARPSLILESDHDHQRIRGAVSASSAVTASNLSGGPGTQPGRKAESTPLGYGRPGWYNDNNI